MKTRTFLSILSFVSCVMLSCSKLEHETVSLNASKDEIHFRSAGGSEVVGLIASSQPIVQVPEWITADVTESYHQNNWILTLKCSQNEDLETREAVVTVKNHSEIVCIVLSQDASEYQKNVMSETEVLVKKLAALHKLYSIEENDDELTLIFYQTDEIISVPRSLVKYYSSDNTYYSVLQFNSGFPAVKLYFEELPTKINLDTEYVEFQKTNVPSECVIKFSIDCVRPEKACVSLVNNCVVVKTTGNHQETIRYAETTLEVNRSNKEGEITVKAFYPGTFKTFDGEDCYHFELNVNNGISADKKIIPIRFI